MLSTSTILAEQSEPTSSPELIVSSSQTAIASNDAYISSGSTIPVGERNSTLFKRAATMFRQGVPYAEVEAAIMGVNIFHLEKSLPDNEALSLIKSAARYHEESTSITLPSMRSLSSYAECPPDVTFCVEKIAVIGSVSMLTGASGIGKTFLGGELVISVASGTPFLGLATEQGDAVFVNTEMPEDAMARRLWQQRQARGLPLDTPAHIITTAGTGMSLNEIHDYILAECHARDIQPKVIFVDSFYLAHSGGDECSATDTTKRMLVLQSIAQKLGAAVVFAHHETKGPQAGKATLDKASGSGVLGRFVAAHVSLSRLDAPSRIEKGSALNPFEPVELMPYRFEWGKHRYTLPPEPVDLWFGHPIFIPDSTGELAGYNLLEGSNSSQRREKTAKAKSNRLVDAIRAHIDTTGEKPTRQELATALDMSPDTLRGHIDKAVDASLITVDSSSRAHRFSVVNS